MSDDSTLKIIPPADLIELAAAVEVTRIIALYAISIATANVQATQQELMRDLKNSIIGVFKKADVLLPPEDANRYRAYGEASTEELFGRVEIGDQPLNPLSS
jgi:hypothetical protein